MILLNSLYIQNYRNIERSTITNFKDFNILVGPNNCGKTNTLKSIDYLNKINGSERILPHCSNNDICNQIQNLYNKRENKNEVLIQGINFEITPDEQYYREKLINLKYSFSSFTINEILKKTYNFDADYILSDIEEQIKKESFSDKNHQEKILTHFQERNEDKTEDLFNPRYTFVLKQFISSNVGSLDVSLFNVPGIINFLKNTVCYIEENRLQSYKDTDITKYIRDKDFPVQQMIKLTSFLKKIIDPKIDDIKQNSLKLVNENKFTTSISEQGSGVRSLICLAVDIMSTADNSIILIDEPELGLNPIAKQEFLKFLIEQSKTKQIFITTHDPTFVNPRLWENENTAVYLYSLIDECFLKVDLNQNNNDPATFAGYLPHTTSIKGIHIYVEGASDVYIFQIFLRKYLKNNFENWSEKLNNIGIYHLNGDYWKHMLSTIPKNPYISLIILDNDKIADAIEICKIYNNMTDLNFKFCDTLDILKIALTNSDDITNLHPVYCLEQKGIESYLDSEFRMGIENYNKKIHGPEIAEKMENIPDEFIFIFKSLLNHISSK